jgi:flagellar M-ring protein FliF
VGFEMLDEQQTFGTSQVHGDGAVSESSQTELAYSIATLNAVQNARVHLALPKQSVFVRTASCPAPRYWSSSILGQGAEAGQVAAMWHLVALACPN